MPTTSQSGCRSLAFPQAGFQMLSGRYGSCCRTQSPRPDLRRLLSRSRILMGTKPRLCLYLPSNPTNQASTSHSMNRQPAVITGRCGNPPCYLILLHHGCTCSFGRFGMQISEDARKDPCPTRTPSEPLDMSAHVRCKSVDLTVALPFLFLSVSLLQSNFLAPHTCIGLESQVPLAVLKFLRLIRPYEPCTPLDGGGFVHWKVRLDELL